MHRGMKQIGKRWVRCLMTSAPMLACALGCALPAAAQSAGEFRLPPGSSSPTPRAQGPVDRDEPVVRVAPVPAPQRSESPPTAVPTPAPTTQPQITPAATPSSQPPQPAGTTTGAATSRPQQSAPQSQNQSPTVGSSDESAPALITASETPSAAPAAPAVLASDPASVSAQSSNIWLWLLPLVAILSAGALWFLRRRWFTTSESDYDADEDVAPEPSPPVAHPSPPPAPKPVVSAASAAPLVLTDESIGLTLDVIRLSATLMNTTLAYKLTVTNHGDEPLVSIVIAGDMVAAHASLPVDQQLATDGQILELRHEIPALSSGDSVECSGEMRLPLAAINPIRSGSSLLFIPLVRFRAEAGETSVLSAFAVGETPRSATAGLSPFRLDLGPRVYSQISQRRIEAVPSA